MPVEREREDEWSPRCLNCKKDTSAPAAMLRAQTRHTPEAVLNGVNIPLVAVCCLHLLGHESRSSSSVPNFQHAQQSLAKFLCQIRRKLAKDLSPERTKAGTATNADL